MSMATIRDVAREAGVSIATVSNTLNKPSVVKPETRDLVMEAVRKLGYIPNANGKRLRAGEARTIGLFIKSMANQFYSELTNSMFLACRQENYELQICLGDSERSILPRLYDHSLDGMVLFQEELSPAARDELIYGSMPLVFLTQEMQGPHISSVLYESREIGKTAADYLLNLGKRRIMHVLGVRGNYDTEERWKGFREELDRRGFEHMEVTLLEGEFLQETALENMRRYLKEGNPVPDAIFAANDLSALGCMSALKEAGYRIPEDVSILGCDDITLCGYVTPNLTTIATNFRETGSLAAQEVIRLIRGGEGRMIYQKGTLIERGSCAASE